MRAISENTTAARHGSFTNGQSDHVRIVVQVDVGAVEEVRAKAKSNSTDGKNSDQMLPGAIVAVAITVVAALSAPFFGVPFVVLAAVLLWGGVIVWVRAVDRKKGGQEREDADAEL